MSEIADADIYAKETPAGDAIEHLGDSAISNSLVLYLTSKPGDFVNAPDKYGPLHALVFKHIEGNAKQKVEFRVRNDINDEYGGIIELQRLDISPHETNQRIKVINLSYRSLISRKIVNVEFLTRSAPQDPPQVFQDVELIGENMLNFTLLNLDKMKGKLLIFDTELNIWVWGQYKLLNFTAADSKFTEILALING